MNDVIMMQPGSEECWCGKAAIHAPHKIWARRWMNSTGKWGTGYSGEAASQPGMCCGTAHPADVIPHNDQFAVLSTAQRAALLGEAAREAGAANWSAIDPGVPQLTCLADCKWVESRVEFALEAA